MAKDSDYTNVLLEDIRSQMQMVLEVALDTHKYVKDVPTRGEFTDLKQDVATIKQAVTDTNRDVFDHEHRIINLEKKLA